MLQKFQEHISQKFAQLHQSKNLIAVSAGLDSMVLVDLCRKLSINFSIIHCNFRLRDKESEAETQFLTQFCEENNIEVFTNYFNTKEYALKNQLSIQVAARNLRYTWFEEILQKHHFNYLLTAHHANDSLETFLINLSRGTGIEGLTGIPERNNYIIRPLLPFSRKQILEYAQENNLKWCEDSSNNQDKYLRNNIRHNVIPKLEELNPLFLESFQNTLQNLEQAQSLVHDAAQNLYNKIVLEENNQLKIDINNLKKHQNYKAYLYQWLKNYGFTAWNDIYNLVEAQSGKQIFSDNYVLLKNRNELILYEKKCFSEVFFIEENLKCLKIPLKLTFKKVNTLKNVDRNTIFVDYDKIQFPLQLRKKIVGDYFYPNGMSGKKKISKFYKDEKFSLADKENQWLLTSSNNIVWVVGKRADKRFLATPKTLNILKIEYKE